MKKIARALTGIVLTGVILTGCFKDPLKNLSGDEARIYITNHDNTSDFRSYTTFSTADSVTVIRNNQFVEKAVSSYDLDLINTFVSKMTGRGYVQVPGNNNPDLVINFSRIYNDLTGYIDYSLYYNGYYGYYDPFYWSYPGYNYYFPPSFYGTYTIRVGGVTIDMFDAKNATTGNELKLIWNGLVRGAGTFNASNIDKSITALFDQSPYIDRR